jgi:hypothetical protein
MQKEKLFLLEGDYALGFCRRNHFTAGLNAEKSVKNWL